MYEEEKKTMKKILKTAVFTALLWSGALAGAADASVIFTFAEAGGTVTMTPSGTLDTSKLVLQRTVATWGGVGIENNGAGQVDIMGGTSAGPVNTTFAFHAGTDGSAIVNPGGPFSVSDFNAIVTSGSRSFTTYSRDAGGLRQPGIGIRATDLAGAFWTPDQQWTWVAGTTFASLGLNPGTYTVADIENGESITIQIGAVPEPASLLLLGMGIAGIAARRRSK
jgi:hypothetical protein